MLISERDLRCEPRVRRRSVTEKRNRRKRIRIIGAAVLAAFVSGAIPVSAASDFAAASGVPVSAAVTAAGTDAASYHDSDPYDYITDRFDVSARADSSHRIHYTEVIDVNFVSGHHGITRYIPENHDIYKVRNLTCEGEPYRVSHDDGNLVIRVGDEDRILTGKKEYVIRYDLVYRKDTRTDRDTLSIDLLPTGWGTSIREATAALTMPKDVDPDSYRIYLGLYGKTDPAGNDDFTISSDGKTVSFAKSDLEKGAGMTVDAALPEGYWEGAPTWLKYSQILRFAAVLMAAVSVILYLIFGRDPEVVRTVEFYPPDQMTPAEVGYVIDGSVDDGDMGSMILYFASKGYLKIREYKKKKYELIRLRPVESSEKPFAAALFRGLFKGVPADKNGETAVRMDRLPEDLYTAVSGAKSSLNDYFAEHKVFRTASSVLRYICLLFAGILYGGTVFASARNSSGAVLAVLAAEVFLLIGFAFVCDGYDRRRSSGRGKTAGRFIAGGVLLILSAAVILLMIGKLSAGFLIVTAVILICGIFMPARTKEGAALYGKVLGFRDFIRDAEYEKMKELSDQDPEYFYTIMPYAYVLGMSTQFAEKFAEMHLKNPDWYESDFRGGFFFSPIWYGSMMNSMSHSFVSAAARPIDSGGGSFDSGSFSGGGFSGGGGGGGGGGAW